MIAGNTKMKGTEWKGVLVAFLKRFRDHALEIRILMVVQIGGILMQRRRDPIPTFCTKVEEEMKGRLQDTEWKVRCRTVNELCDVAAMDLKCISSSTLQSLGERMKDKSVVIRKEAMTGLAQIFASHSKEKTLRWIPEFICKCFAYPEME